MAPSNPPVADPSTSEKTLSAAHLAKGAEKLREMRAAGWKPVHRSPVEQYHARPTSTKAAIKAFCWICVGADADPGAKFRVRDCAVGAKCPLFNHRPWQAVKGGLQHAADGTVTESDESDDSDDNLED